MTVEKQYTDKMRDSFQERLRKRTEKMDADSKLRDMFEGNLGYWYATGLNFGKLFKSAQKHPLIEAFREVMDNAGVDDGLEIALVFSRPSDVIYIMVDTAWYFMNDIRPQLVVRVDGVGDLVILKLEDFLAEMP